MIGAYYVLGLVGLTSALAIVAELGHPVNRIAFLVVVFLATSLEYIIVDYTFLGLTLIIVYCGAIAIIFLFVIMMVTRPTDDKPTNRNRYLVVVVLIAGIAGIAGIADTANTANTANLVNFVHLTNWASEFILLTDLHLFACMVYIGYPTALILISIALWIVMVAIIKLTVKQT